MMEYSIQFYKLPACKVTIYLAITKTLSYMVNLDVFCNLLIFYKLIFHKTLSEIILESQPVQIQIRSNVLSAKAINGQQRVKGSCLYVYWCAYLWFSCFQTGQASMKGLDTAFWASTKALVSSESGSSSH